MMPILMITAKDSASDKQACFRAGIDDYMSSLSMSMEMIWRVGGAIAAVPKSSAKES